MKKINQLLLPLCLIAFTFFGTQQANAQIVSSACTSLPIVASSCIGACAPSSVISHHVGPLCTSAVVNLCLNTDNSSLCPSHIAISRVYVNGVLVAVGNMTSTGATLSFSAPCGSKVKVITHLKHVNPYVNCIWLGEVDLNLHQQP